MVYNDISPDWMNDRIIDTVNDIITLSKSRKVTHLVTEDQSYEGRIISIEGRQLINFGSYGYLGLELDKRLKDAAIDAIERYGIQYPSSRAYVSNTLYTELEGLIQKMFDAPVVLATTTTLGHQAVMPVIVSEQDAIILDQQVHSSVQDVALKLQLKGVKVVIVRHNKLDELEKKIQELRNKHRVVWYMCDGVYSMYGDCAPVEQLVEIANRISNFYLYIDDAHGMSWAGKNGVGYVLSKTALHPKMILATSLNKAYAAGGAVFVIPDAALCEKVRNCGGPLIFAGQHQMAALGAGIACAKIHLSQEISYLQNDLKKKIAYCQQLLEECELPIISSPETPIFFIGLGVTKLAINMVRKMFFDSFYVNISHFPAVPESCTGIRFSITCHHTFSDIENLVKSINTNFHKVLEEENRSIEDIYRAFRKVKEFKGYKTKKTTEPHTLVKTALRLQHEESIENIDRETWDHLLGSAGIIDKAGLHFLEKVYRNNPKPENNWDFHYFIIRDANDELVLATFFTVALIKDDLLAPDGVSRQIEKLRAKDPYYLTSKMLMMGSLVSEGQHCYINRSHSRWRQALILLLDNLWRLQEKHSLSSIYLRDFSTRDTEIHDFLFDQGFLKIALPDNHTIKAVNWKTPLEYLNRLKSDNRYYVKRKALKYELFYDVELVQNPSQEEIKQFYELYQNVRQRSFEINSFDVPLKFIEEALKYPEWELISLKLKPEYRQEDKPIGMALNYKTKNTYVFCITGMDYNFLHSHHIYPQILWQTVQRAAQLKIKCLKLGLTASQNKRKFGAKTVNQVSYVQTQDTYNLSVINAIANK